MKVDKQMESDKNARASGLINRFKSLVKHAETVIFPKTKNSVFLPINMETWLPVRKVLYKASVPYMYINEKQNGDILYIILSLFVLVMTISAWILAEKIAKLIPIGTGWFQFSLLTVYLFLSLYGALGFVRDPRYPIIVRIIFSIFLILSSLITAGNLFPINLNGVHETTSLPRYFKVYFLIFSVLSTTILFCINTFLSAFLAYIQFLRHTKAIQTPTTDKAIEELLHAEIADTELKGETWQLLDLSENEIVYLRFWSESNLSSSEKRTTPAVIVVALAGLIFSIDEVRNFLIPVLTTNSRSWLSYSLLFILTTFVVIFSETMISLFKNIAIQSLIVEACLVAKYTIKEGKDEHVSKSNFDIRVIFNSIVEATKRLIYK